MLLGYITSTRQTSISYTSRTKPFAATSRKAYGLRPLSTLVRSQLLSNIPTLATTSWVGVASPALGRLTPNVAAILFFGTWVLWLSFLLALPSSFHQRSSPIPTYQSNQMNVATLSLNIAPAAFCATLQTDFELRRSFLLQRRGRNKHSMKQIGQDVGSGVWTCFRNYLSSCPIIACRL